MDGEGWSEVGARVAEARKTRGLSQSALAEAMELDRTAIAKIETGRRQINSLELVRLGEVLQRPLSWFVAPSPAVIASRRAATAEQRQDLSGEYALEDALRDLQTLLDARTLRPKPAAPGFRSFASDDREGVLLAACQARELLGADNSAPLHGLAALVESLGLYAWTAPLGQASLHGAYAGNETVEGTGVAVVNSSLDAGRRRSTLAHELGHHLLRDSHSSDWGVSTGENEQAIDAFAAAFLLPPGVSGRWAALSQDWTPRQRTILIAAEYRVSWTTALKQLRDYGLLRGDEWREVSRASPTRADYLECGVSVVEELQGRQAPPGIQAAAVRAYRTHKISASRALEIIQDESLSKEDLDQPDSIPLEALWGEIGNDVTR